MSDGTSTRSILLGSAKFLLELIRRCPRSVSATTARNDSRLTSRPTAAKPLTMAIMMFGVIGILAAVAHAEQPTADSKSDGNATPIGTPILIVTKDPAPPTPAISIRGIVRDLEGKVLGGMHVVLRARFFRSNDWFAGASGRDFNVLARTRTDREGRFIFRDVGIPPRMIGVLGNLRDGNTGAQIVVWGDGKAVAWMPVRSFQPPDMDVRLAPEADVSGVVADQDGQPLDGVVLRVGAIARGGNGANSMLPGQFAATSHNGRFAIHNMPKDAQFRVFCTGPTGERGDFKVDTGSAPPAPHDGAPSQSVLHRSPIEATITRNPYVKIRIVDHRGRPVSGGWIRVVEPDRFGDDTAEVDDDGTAILAIRHPGENYVYYHSNPLTPEVNVIHSLDLQPDKSPEVEIKLPASRRLIGRVIDSDTGAPVVGAYLLCQPPENAGGFPRLAQSLVVSNKDGVFMPPLADGTWRVLIKYPIDGYYVPPVRGAPPFANQPGVFEVAVEPGKIVPRLIIKLSRGLSIEGAVVDADGRPQAGLPVRAANDDSRDRTVFVVTDPKGQFHLHGLSPHDDARVWTWSQSAAAEQKIPPTRDHPWNKTLSKPVTLTLATGISLKGRVLRDGRPIAGVRVELRRTRRTIPGRRNTFVPLFETTTDENGRYRLPGLELRDYYRVEIQRPENTELRDWKYGNPSTHVVRADDPDPIVLPDAQLVSQEHN